MQGSACITEVDENQVINTDSMGTHYYATRGGIKKDGTPTFLETVFHCNVGGIVDGGYTGVYPVSEAALAVYNYESCAVENFPVWCNLNPSGARRSYGGAEGMFCSESFIDEMLEKIDADPVEWRLGTGAQKTGDPVTIRLEWGELAGCDSAALDCQGRRSLSVEGALEGLARSHLGQGLEAPRHRDRPGDARDR